MLSNQKHKSIQILSHNKKNKLAFFILTIFDTVDKKTKYNVEQINASAVIEKDKHKKAI